MRYLLMHKDIETAVIEFSEEGELISLSEVLQSAHLPLEIKRDNSYASKWWKNRAVPKARKKQPNKSPSKWLLDNLGLSLSDCYWIKPIDSSLNWSGVNLYANDFEVLSLESNYSSYTPDASTGGELPKLWTVENGKRVLIKGNSTGSSMQSRNEVLASLIHKSQSFSHVDYTLVDIEENGSISAGVKCECFTSEDKEFIPAASLISRLKPIADEPYRDNFIRSSIDIGFKREDVMHFLDYMALSDFLISNTDRHFNNFGFLRDPDSLEFISFAPLFDSGNSMMYRNIYSISFAASLRERTNSFYNGFKSSIEHIENFNVLDISKFPDSEKLKSLYPKDVFGERIVCSIKRLYEDHIEFIKRLQSGVSFYDAKKELAPDVDIKASYRL